MELTPAKQRLLSEIAWNIAVVDLLHEELARREV
jgi:hypothetical protein